MLFVENVRTCRMLYVMMGLRVADCTRASSTEGFRFFEVCQSLFGQDRILRVNTCEPVCVRNGLHVHTCWVNVYILQLQISVFFFNFSSSKTFSHQQQRYSTVHLFLWMLKDMKSTYKRCGWMPVRWKKDEQAQRHVRESVLHGSASMR